MLGQVISGYVWLLQVSSGKVRLVQLNLW